MSDSATTTTTTEQEISGGGMQMQCATPPESHFQDGRNHKAEEVAPPCDEAELVVVALLQPALPGGHRVGRHGHCALLPENAAAGGHVS